MSFFGFFKKAAPAPVTPEITPTSKSPERRNPGQVRFCPVFSNASCGAPHQTFIGASQQSHNVARVMRVEIDPRTLDLISVVMLRRDDATPIGVAHGL